MNAITCRDLTKTYQGFTLDHITFSLPAGCILGLVGENGAGKSTTLRLLMNAISRDGGQVSLLGTDNQSPEFLQTKQDIGVVLDEACLPEVITPRELGKLMSLTYTRWDQAQYDQYLDRFSIPRGKKFKDFSRGMKMKLAIAAALSHHPDLLILDEPTSGLDPLVRDEILDIFLDFLQDETRAVILSSHITSDLDKVADTIALLHEGKLLFHEEKDVLREDYAVVKGGADQRRVLNDADFIGVHENAFGFEALCRRDVARRYPALTAERPTIEEIMLFYTRKKKGGRS